jgi:DNA-directed RNA polymerase specialized sigma24 family protein
MDDEIRLPEAEKHVRALVPWVQAQDTEIARAHAARWAMRLLAEVTNEISTARIGAVRVLWQEGWSLTDIAEALGMSRARVHQIIQK